MVNLQTPATAGDEPFHGLERFAAHMMFNAFGIDIRRLG